MKPKFEKYDLIFTNIISRLYEPETTIKYWISTLTENGVIVIENKNQIKKEPDKVNCFAYTVGELANSVKSWTKGEYKLARTFKVKPPRTTVYYIIERA